MRALDTGSDHSAALSRVAVIVGVALAISLAAVWLLGPQADRAALACGWGLALVAAAAQRRAGAVGEYSFLLFLYSSVAGSFLVLAGGDNATLFDSLASLVAMAGLLAAPVPQDRSLRALAVFASLAVAVTAVGASGITLGTLQANLVLWFSGLALAGLLLRTQRERREQGRMRELERMAMLDPLTGLMNRRSAFDRLEGALASAAGGGRPFALAVVDLDGFKGVNDAFGHDAGDRVLMQVAELLRAPRDAATPQLAARLGGDEFIAAWSDIGEAQAWKLAEHLRLRVQAIRLEECGGAALVDCSIGVVVRKPGGAPESLAALIRRADKLMYDIKHRRHAATAQAA